MHERVVGRGRVARCRRPRTSGSRRPTGSEGRPRSPAVRRDRGGEGRAPCGPLASSSATSSNRSPGSASRRVRRAASSSSERNLATGDSSSSSLTRIHTRPLAPNCLARSVRASRRDRPISPCSATRMPLTQPASAKALNPVWREDVGELDELHAESDVGLVAAVAFHGVVPRHAGHGRGPDTGDRLAHVEQDHFDGGEHVLLVGEGHLGVELDELELPVGAQVLVAQAPGDLVVAVDPADHQQLLEQLRALGQHVERTRLLTRRHDEVAGAFGCRGDQHRRLDLDEPLTLHRRADRAVDRGPQTQVALHAIAAQVDVAVAEPDHARRRRCDR